MTDRTLSPAAQAVLGAVRAVPILLNDQQERIGIAAALRAAAEEVVPYEATAPWDELKCDYDGDRWEMRQYVRDKFLAIAAELEAQ